VSTGGTSDGVRLSPCKTSWNHQVYTEAHRSVASNGVAAASRFGRDSGMKLAKKGKVPEESPERRRVPRLEFTERGKTAPYGNPEDAPGEK